MYVCTGGEIGTVFGATAAKAPPLMRPYFSAYNAQQNSQTMLADRYSNATGEGQPDNIAANLEDFVPLEAPATTVKLKEALGSLSVATVLRHALHL